MNFLIDTNVICEKAKRKPNAAVESFWKNVQLNKWHVFLSELTVGEIYSGIVKLEKNGDRSQSRKIRKWWHGIEQEYTHCFLPVTRDITVLWGTVLATTDKTNPIDKLMAATALLHDLVLVTRNTKHLMGTGVQLYNPFLNPDPLINPEDFKRALNY